MYVSSHSFAEMYLSSQNMFIKLCLIIVLVPLFLLAHEIDVLILKSFSFGHSFIYLNLKMVIYHI